MSRKALIVAVAVALLLATWVAPVMGAPDDAQDVALDRVQGWSMPADDALILAPPIQLNGGSECGGGGGCPV
jgi:hypothetical protein